jgi:hypothetical protein
MLWELSDLPLEIYTPLADALGIEEADRLARRVAASLPPQAASRPPSTAQAKKRPQS